MSWPLEGEQTVWVRGQLLWILLCVLELTGHSSLTVGTSLDLLERRRVLVW